jgi:lysozyme family protein
MADYRILIPFLKEAEGGLSRAKTDRASVDATSQGYHTNKGITWKTFKTLAPLLGYVATEGLFMQMPYHTWLKIYKYGYWDKIKGDYINSQAIADLMADMSFNSGPVNAIVQMQKTLGSLGKPVAVDGIIGPQTLAAINTSAERTLFDAFAKTRERFYRSIISNDPTQKANEDGWFNRLEKLVTLKKKSLDTPSLV